MTTFGMNNQVLVKKSRTRPYAFLTVVVIGFLTSCSMGNFKTSSADWRGLGQMWAKDSCRNQINERDYQVCISQVDETYDAYSK